MLRRVRDRLASTFRGIGRAGKAGPRFSLRTMFLVHLLVIAAAAALLVPVFVNLNPAPANADKVACPSLRGSDDLRHLALRNRDAASAELARWNTCTSSSIARDARHSLGWDRALIAVLAAAFALAVIRCWRRVRWRLAAYIAGTLAIVYVIADIAEDAYLGSLLDGSPPSHYMRWAAAIKFGAFFGALPIVVVSLLLAWSEWRSPRDRPKFPRRRGALKAFRERWLHRIRNERRAARPERYDVPPAAALGVSCSGGGIRSAAFSLGALQALDTYETESETGTETDAKPKTARRSELSKAEWLSSVSGGSYLAAAWVSARAARAAEDAAAGASAAFDQRPIPYTRLSPEEDHLRRHSSYLAPGVTGKVWALARFLLGFALNLLLVALALASFFLPYGWYVNAHEHARPLRGGSALVLARGGCIELPDGKRLVAVAGTTLRVTGGARIPLDPGAAAIPPATKAKPDAKKSEEQPRERRRRRESVPKARPTLPGVVSCPGEASEPAALATGVRAAALDQRLEKKTGVVLRLDPNLAVDRALPVSGRNVFACPADAEVGGGPQTCRESEADGFQVPTKSRLLSAPSAVATLAGPGIVKLDQSESQPRASDDVKAEPDHVVVNACGTHACVSSAPPASLRSLLFGLAGLTLLLGICHVVVRPRPVTSAIVQRILKWMGVATFAVFAFAELGPYLVVWAENGRWWLEDEFQLALPGGIATIAAALVSQLAAFSGSGGTAGSASTKIPSFVKSLASGSRKMLVRLAGAVVGPLLVLVSGILIASYAAERPRHDAGQFGLWLFVLGFLAFLLAGGDLNEWSLHPFYRDRLREGFVIPAATADGQKKRLAALWETERLDHALSDARPKLMLCAAANLADEHLTAPGRPVVPWVFTRELVGSDAIGRALRPSALPSGVVTPETLYECDPPLASLATAVAVSGAAFSPAMGKMTKPERFLFALGNLRLGVWYPNPTWLEIDDSGYYASHHPRPWYLVKEAFGLHRVEDPWIYVTDGGHYENLGLVELLRKGCREIYCFDGSGDTTDTFGTIAEAMRLAREELDIKITFDPKEMEPDKDGVSPLGAWAASVKFPSEPVDGWIVFAKLEVPSHAPFDVIDMARTLPSFPSNPTMDQLYTDQKFEAYRALGEYLGEQAATIGSDIRANVAAGLSVSDAVDTANAAITPPPPGPLKVAIVDD